jgi:hypothetical protein
VSVLSGEAQIDSSIVETFETHCENFQLILAYSIINFKNDYFGSIAEIKTPYKDPDFEGLIRLATAWRSYREIWERIKFLNWKPKRIGKENTKILFIPDDIDEFMRTEIGFIRLQEISSEASFHFNSVPINFSDKDELINDISNTLSLSKDGHYWDGQIDLNLFRKAIINPKKFGFSQLMLDYFHYYPAINEMKIGTQGRNITLSEYLSISSALYVLAKSITQAINNKYPDISIPQDKMLTRILTIERSRLIEILSHCCGIASDECEKGISILTFDPKQRRLEIWDTPLILANENHLILIPSIITNASPVRAIENIISQWDEGLFTKRGKILERDLINNLKLNHNICTQGPINITVIGFGNVEFDMALYWDKHLLLVETKCTKSIFTPSEYYRAKKHIEDAIEQLNIRKKVVIQNWDIFREAAIELKLPRHKIGIDNIHLLVITNVLQFTGWVNRNVIVTDEYCVNRFFEEPEIEEFQEYRGNRKVNNIGMIRNSSKLDIKEFIKYLRHPPQVEIVRSNMKTGYSPLLRINKDDPQLGVMHIRYVPGKQKDDIIKITGKHPLRKKGHRHH